MYTMIYSVKVGEHTLGMLDKVDIHRSVELLADTATITLPASEYNKRLSIEQELKRGDKVSIALGYEETGLVDEFVGYLQRISTDKGSITLYCEDDLYAFRKPVTNEVFKKISLQKLLEKLCKTIGSEYKVVCSYEWTYDKFTFHNATAFDVLKKVQEESGADIYLDGTTLHVHPPGEVIGKERLYDFAVNIEKADLSYKRAEDKKIQVVVKALLPDGKVRQVEVGTTGGDKVEVKCPTSDEASMRRRGESELLRRTYDGYDGTITGWLIPECKPSDTVTLHDEDYPEQDGSYFVRSVKTSFSSQGGKREITLGFRLS